MKRLFSCLFFICSYHFANSQCGSGNIILQTQADVDNFSVNYPGCHRILGGIEIIGTNIENLDGLSVIDSVDRYFTIDNNPDLYNIHGLKNLITVEDFVVKRCPLIEDLTAFQNLQIASNSLILSELNIINLKGLDRLKYVRQFILSDNSKLEELNGLDSLMRTPTLSIFNNNKLQNLNGLNSDIEISQLTVSGNENLVRLTDLKLDQLYSLDLRSNPKLVDIFGLSKINTVWFLNIVRNNSLTKLNGLESLKTINFHLRLEENDSLEDISALKNVIATSPDSLIIRKNPNLSICNNDFICKYLEDSSKIARISGNKLGCNTRAEVEKECLKTSTYNINHSIQVFPNPANDYILITGINGLIRVGLYNSYGQNVFSSSTDQSQLKIDCAFLAKGIYMLKLNEKTNSKIVIVE